MMIPKAADADMVGRFREIISDPLNLLIERVPNAGIVTNNLVCLHNGNLVPASGPTAYYEGFAVVLVINRGVHEPLEEYVFQELMRVVPTAPSMLELGAYWGHYSMWLKKLRPAANVTLVEPEPPNLAAGVENFKRHGYVGEFINLPVARGHFAVDEWMEKRGLDHLDILHCDIQGYEIEMLDGARRTFGRGAIDYVFLSTHSAALHAEATRVLTHFGYRVEVSSDYELETTSFDGFLFASHPRVAPVIPMDPRFTRVGILQSKPRELIEQLVKVSSAATR